MKRSCFLLKVVPERLPEYLAAHETVWPSMLEALTRTGWRNYSLFLYESEGLVVGYFESDDPEATMSAMSEEEVNTRWQESMAAYFAATNAGAQPGESVPLREHFHLA